MWIAAVAAAALLLPLPASPAKGKAAKPAAAAPVKTEPPPAATIDGPGALDEPRKVAEAYLKALEGKGDDTAKRYLLGGLTLTAQDFTIPNWRIASRDVARVEEKPLFDAVKAMWLLDKVGAESLNTVVVAEGDQLTLSQEQAAKILGPTREQALKFQESFPLFAYVARVGRDVFWHPDNPWRAEVKKLGKEGSYTLELHRFSIEENEKGRPPRLWPLRVLRVKTKAYDSGWKILPASEWDPNY